MPKRPVQTPITDQEIAFAHLVLAGTMTDKAAAKVVGIDPRRAAYVKNKPKVQAYMEEHRASVRSGLVQHEVEALAKFNIGRERILAKWWEFANIDPAKGYNTSSQSRALELLWKGLGYADPDPKKPGDEGEPEPEKPQIYRAKWMRKPGDPDYEEEPDIFQPEWLNETKRPETKDNIEAALSIPAPPPMPVPSQVERPAPALPAIRAVDTLGKAVETPYRMHGAAFGRFQGL